MKEKKDKEKLAQETEADKAKKAADTFDEASYYRDQKHEIGGDDRKKKADQGGRK